VKKDLFDFPVQYIKGIGPRKARLLSRLGIKSIYDALYYLPHRYEDRRSSPDIRSIRYDTLQTVMAKVLSANLVETKRAKMKIFEAVVTDGTATLTAKWFNQPFMKGIIKPGISLVLSGTVKKSFVWGVGYEMHNPEYEIIENDSQGEKIHTSRIVPIYRTTAGLSQRMIRSAMYSIIRHATEEMEDYMPGEIVQRNHLPCLRDAIRNVHFPDHDDMEELLRGTSPYHRRLSFDELFILQTGLAILKRAQTFTRGITFQARGELFRKLLEILPFQLTGAQKRVIGEILSDMKSQRAMNRLIQGDVGSGKTIVAFSAMLQAIESGYQAALMAPTEILAEQHYLNLHRLAEAMGLKAALLTGSKRDKPLEEISRGEVDIVIGTHALIQKGVEFKRLGLVVIDEQHRFGVLQRALLRKKGANPDVLVMTATPIPRTLSLTLYGDLDYSVIDELPPNRRPVVTKLYRPEQKSLIYSLIRSEVKKGRQAYVVYPVIEESEKLALKDAIQGRERLERQFPEFRIGLIHGRMKPHEREEVMERFKRGEIEILVSTTVIEVGVDVPNATVMLIVHAERFGLSQLHQLRGRVGRGAEQSYCLLLAYGRLSEEARRRLQVMVSHTDGFRIAEEDFKIRGPGELFGTRQSGMPDLRVANLIRDAGLLDAARREAFQLVEEDPELKRYPQLRSVVARYWKDKLEIFRTG